MFNRAFIRPKDRYFQSYIEDIQMFLYFWLCNILNKLMYDIAVKYDYILMDAFIFNLRLTRYLISLNTRVAITGLLVRWIFHSMRIFIIRHDKVRYQCAIIAIFGFHKQCRISIKVINSCIDECNQILMKGRFKYRFTNLHI
jgi:hypothetical protein